MELYTEKYRPKSREEIVGNKEVVDKIFGMAENIPHLLLAGPAGCGKTTIALALGRLLFGENYRQNFLELNASDDNGINVIRGLVKDFAKTTPLSSDFKIILLDEADNMSTDAQEALRRTMERYARITRFVLSCNREEKIIDPIKSRCQVFRLSPLTSEDILLRLKFIAEEEKLIATEEGLKRIAEDAGGDMRTALNWLQVLATSKMPITPESYAQKKKADLPEAVWDNLKAGRFLQARTKVLEYLTLGYSEREIIEMLHKSLLGRRDIKYITRGELVIRLAEVDYRLTLGVSKGLQMDAMLLSMLKVFKEDKNKPDGVDWN